MKCTSGVLSHFDICFNHFCSTPESACEVHLSLFKIQTKGSTLYLSLLNGTCFEQTPASVSTLSEPSDALLCWVGSVYLYQVLCMCKNEHIIQGNCLCFTVEELYAL